VKGLRLLAAIGVAVAIVGLVVAALPQRAAPAPAPAGGGAPAPLLAPPAPAETRGERAGDGEARATEPGDGAGPRPRVPAGILARAAKARALERGPACPASARAQETPRCPAERASIDIDWHVAREP
jgi:hypothetical protein